MLAAKFQLDSQCLGNLRGFNRQPTSIQYCVIGLSCGILCYYCLWQWQILGNSMGARRCWKFLFLSADSLEKFAKTLLVKTKLVDSAGSDAADIHPALGALCAVHASLHSPACQPVRK